MSGSSFKVGGYQPLDRRYALSAINWVAIGGTDSPFTGTWVTNPFGVTFRNPAYVLDGFGLVHLRGLISNTVSWPGATMFTLPAAYRPAATESFVVAVLGTPATGTATIQAKSTGNVDFIGSNDAAWTATNWLSLSGITWGIA